MTTLEEMAARIAHTGGEWNRGFAEQTAPMVTASTDALVRWADRMARGLMSGGEEDARLALERRSQLVLARHLYHDTGAATTLEFLWDPGESDDELRERAEQVGLYGPDYLPASHRWWKGLVPLVGPH
jgi:hypothetical protein